MKIKYTLKYILVIAAIFLINEAVFAQCPLTTPVINTNPAAATCAQQPINFNITPASIDANASYTWDFGDPTSNSNTATGTSASHSFSPTAAGATYTVTVNGSYTNTEDVNWTDFVNTSASGTTLTKTNSSNSFNAGAASTQTLDDDDFVTFIADATTRTFVGLSTNNTSGNQNSIDYAIFARNGTMFIRENGTNRGNFGSYSTGDEFKIAIENNQVVYYRNNVAFYTSNVTPTLPMVVDVSINTGNSTITGATVTINCSTSATTTVTTNPTPTFTVGSSGFDKQQTCQAIINPGSSLNVAFGIATGYNNAATYTWDFGDGTPPSVIAGNIATYNYSNQGVYIVTVTADDGSGCIGTFSDTIFYLDRPLANMNIIGTADVCEGDTVFTINNTDTVGNRIIYYVWEWDDGTRDTVYYRANSSHLYEIGDDVACNSIPSGGLPYNVTLFAVNECFEHTNSSPITVSQTPTGNLSGDAIVCESIASTTGIDFNLDYCTWGISGEPSWNFDDPTSGASDTLAFSPNYNHIFAGGPGIYNVTVDINNRCGDYSDSIQIQILEEPIANASFSTNGGAIANGDGCNPVELYYNNTSTGDSLNYNWNVSPSGGVSYVNGTSDTSANPQFLFNTSGTFIITMEAYNLCGSSFFYDTVNIVDGPTVTLNAPTPTCDSFTYSPSVTYFPGGGVINTYAWEFRRSDGTILGTSNLDFPMFTFTSPGDYVAAVTITNDCTSETAAIAFTIEGTPNPITISGGLVQEVCIDAAPFQLSANPTGGVWSGSGVNASGLFTPSSVVAGTYTIYYTYNNGNGCPAEIPVEITVNPLPIVNVGGNQNVCINDAPFDLTSGTPTGGIWSGDGITNAINGTFDPSAAGIGSHTVTYTYQDANGCENSDDLVINVRALPTVNAQGDETYCLVNYDIQLNTPSPIGGIWTGAGALYNNQGFFNIDSAGGLGIYPIYYTYTDANGCTNADTIDITIVNNLVVEAGNPDTVCINNNNYTLTGYSPGGGVWSGAGIIGTGPQFSPQVAGLGSHTLTYTVGSGTCQGSDVVDIFVADFTPVNAGNDTAVCAETAAFTLAAASPLGGVWSGTGITDINNGIFDPNNAGEGTFTLTYTYIDPVTDCESSDNIQVTVNPLPTINLPVTETRCDTSVGFAITGYSPTGGTWSGLGITDAANGIFNAQAAGATGIGNYIVYYNYIDNNGCENIDSLPIEVVFGDTLRLESYRDTICINNGNYSITNFEPTGGTWSGNGIFNGSSNNPQFSPQAAGIGTHVLTYVVGTLSCRKEIELTIVVQDIPTVNAGTDTLLCVNTNPIELTGFSPAGGVWTGSGLQSSNGLTSFDPTIGSGAYTLTYTYTDPVTGCFNSDTKTITVSPIPTVTVTSPVTYCLIPDDILLTNYNPAGGVWSGQGVVDANNGVFNGDTAGGVGNYTLTYTFTDGNGCINSDDLDIMLIGIDTAEAGPGDTLCVYDAPINLTGNSPLGGDWSGTGIIDATNGTFDPGQVSAGTYTITYTVGTGTCENEDETTVLVGGVPNVNARADEERCITDTAFTLLTATPANGTWSGTGITDAITGVFDPATAGSGLHTLTYTYINPLTGCVGSDTKNVRVRPLPTVNAGDTVAYCNTPNNINLTGYTPTSGGIWSGPGIVDANNGVFNPITAGDVGAYDVVLTFTNSFGCTNADTLRINVVAGDTVNAGPNDTLCVDDAAIMLNGFPTGGTWSGAGITSSTGIFDPSQVSAGLYYPVYTVGTGTCERKDTIEILVSGLPFVEAGNDVEICIDNGIFTLTGQNPLTGYWQGAGIIDSIAGTFDPTLVGVGTHIVSYVVTNGFGCDNFDTKTIRINPLPTVFAGDTVIYCFNNDNIQLTGFTPASGGIWTGTGIVDANNGIFNANSAGATGIGVYDDIVLTFTDNKGCINSDSLVVQIVFGDTINAGNDLAMCIDNGLDTLTGYIPTFGGTWSGTGIVNSNLGVFDPATAGGGIHELVYTFGTGTCLKRDTIEVLVGTIPTVEAGQNNTVCIDEPAFNFVGFSPANGFWSGVGITDSLAGTFNPDSAGAGLHTLTYTFINPITGCENFDTKTIRVNPLPIVNAGDTVIYCDNPNNITLAGYSPLGGTWSGTGIIDANNGIFNTVQAGGIGTYYPTYTFIDNNGCENTDTLVIEVIFGDTVDAGPNFGVCITDGQITINNGYQPSTGGTWSGPGIIDAANGIFDVSLVTPNQFTTVYFTFGTGTCQKFDSTRIFVGLVPTVEAGQNDTICELDGLLTLSGFVPATQGVWSGTGIVPNTNTFDPSLSGTGTFTLTYYFINSFTGCENQDTKTVTVVPAPTVNAGSDQIVCDNVNDIVLSGYSPLGGTWTGPGITNPSGVFNTVIAGGVGTYDLVYTYVDVTGCSNRDTVQYEVIFGDTVTAGPNRNVCIDGGFVTLNGSPNGGTWSGNGIINPNGTFDPQAAGVGFHTLSYTFGTGTCQKTSTMQIFVSPPLTINAGNDETYCSADAAFALSGYVPSSGGTWSGTGITDATNGIFNPAVAGVGTHTITYSFTNVNTGCSDTDTKIITVTPPPVVNAGNDQVYCNSNNNITLSGYSPSGGIWSGPGIVDALGGIFNTQSAGGIGTYELIYAFTSGSCSDRDTIIIDVIFGDTVVAGQNDTACIDDANFLLSGFSPIGGTWTGNGIVNGTTGEFSPNIAGVGTHTITYTFGTGTCEKSVAKTVFIDALPIVNAGNDQTVCINEPTFNLSGFSPIGGVWTGNGIVNNNQFDAATAGIGTHTLTYTFTNTFTGCDNFDTKEITVNPLPIITMLDTVVYCDNPNNITLSGYSPTGGTWSGAGIVDATNGIFSTTQAGGIGVYTLTYSFTNANGCTNTEDLIIDVIFGDTVVAGQNDTACIDDANFLLSGFSPIGGTWSGNGIVNGATGEFSPNTAGVGTHTITYTFGTGTCEKSVTKTVFIDALPIVNAGNNQTVCINEPTFTLSGFSPIGGVWTGNGIINNNQFDAATAGIGTHTLTYTFTNPFTGCDNFDTKTIVVNPLPIITMLDTVVYCDNPNNITLSGYSPTGGTWSGAGIVDANNGIFSTTQAGGIGVYTLVYSFTNANGCTNTEDLIVDVIFGDTVVAGQNDTACIDDANFLLSGFSPIGGTWSGNGIVNGTTGEFSPNTAGVGTHTITYTFGTGTCEKSVTKTVFIDALPIVNAGNNQTVCINEPTFTLSGFSPIGGVWTGNGIINNNEFDAATAGIGTHTLTYTFTNPFTGCDNFDTKTIVVNPLPIITMLDTVVYCDNPNNITLSGYSPTGGTWSGAGIIDANNGIFSTTQAGGIGVYTLTYSFTNANGCTNTEDLIVDVIFGDTVVAGQNDTACIDDMNFLLSGFSPIGGTWSGNGIVNGATGEFSPNTAGVGTHTITYTFGTGTCEKSVTKTVFIDALPIVNAGNNQTVCINEPTFTLSGFSPIGGVWTGNGIVNNNQFDAATAGVGTHTLTYTFTNPFTGCDNFDTKEITVNPLPIITMLDTVVYCDNPNNITLSGYSPTGGTWSGAGIVDANNGIFSTTQAGGIGVYTLTYSFTNANGCTNTEDLIVDVIFGDTVVAGPLVEVCFDDGAFALVGFSPTGGTFSGTGITDANNGIFDPAFAGVGTHIITYSFGTGTCQKIVSGTVVVHPVPVVNAGNDEQVCLNTTPFILGGQSPTNGIWSGNGITNGTVGMFDASVAGIGTHTITYTFTNNTTGCSATDTKLITVNPLPVVTVQDTVIYCLSNNNITLSGYSPLGGTWSGTGIVDGNNGIFNGNIAGGVGFYTATYTFTDANNCANSATMIIEVEPAFVVEAGPDTSICIDYGNYQLTGFSPTGGTWTGAGIIDAANGIFDPQVAGTGPITLTYTFGNASCQNSDNITIFVGTPPTVSAGNDQTVCSTDAAFSLNGFSPPNGIWTGTGVTNPNGIFDPAVAGAGTFTLTYTYTNPTTLCEDFDTKEITVLPPPAVFAGDTVVYCNTNQNITLTNYTPLGGIWNGTGIVDNQNGIFNPNVAGGEGRYLLTYSFTNAIGCSNFDTLTVEVIFGDTVYAGLPDTVCIDDAQFTLTGFTPTSGGTWTGNGIVDANAGIFDPATAGVGNHTISYTFGTGTCQKTSTKTVFVGALPTINIGANDTICISEPAFNIVGYSPQGGTWTGAGITDAIAGTFDPAIVGVGTHTVTYTFVNAVTGCDRTVSKQIIVRPLPNVFTTNTVTYCNNPNDITLTGFSPQGGVWTGSGIIASSGIFNTTIAGGLGYNGGDTTYLLTYTFTDNFGCENSSDMLVTVEFGDTVQAGPNINVCIDDAQFNLVGQLPASGGTWSGNGIIDPVLGTFDPATAGAGQHILTWTFGTGTCQKISTRTVTVSNLPNISAGVDETFCINDAPILLSSYTPIGGTWSGTGITDSITGEFSPMVAGVGTFTLTYYFYNAATNCDVSDTKIVTVRPLPTVTTQNTIIYCDNPNDITLTGYSPIGGIWTGAGILDANAGIFNTQSAGGLGYNGGDTTYLLTYTFTDNFGCENSSDMLVTVEFGDTVQAGPNINVCIDDAQFNLVGQLPASGGTWSGNGIIDPVLGTFDPATAGAGQHILTWTFGTGTCQKISTRTVTVSNLPNISAGVDETFCINDAPILLSSYTPIGGTWSGTGITDSITGEFSPMVAGVGTFTLTYYFYNAATNCDVSDTKIVTVRPLPTVTTQNTILYCDNPNDITLTGYSPTGGIWTGAGILDANAGIFNTQSAGGLAYNGGDTTYLLTYTFTDNFGCENSSDMLVTVEFGDTVQAGPNINVCIDDAQFNLVGQLPASGGTWSGNGIIDPVLGTFDPATAGAGQHILTWTFGTGTCQKISTRTVTVSNLPNISAGVDETFCINDAPILLSSYTPIGGIWSGTGITDSITGEFSPTVAGVGTHTLTYYFYNAATNCDVSDTKIVTVAPLPTVTTQDSVIYCDNPNNITLTGYSPQGGIWSGAGIVDGTNGIFNTNQAGGLGIYNLTYTYTDGNGCANTADLQVEVIFGDTVEAGGNFAICEDNGLLTLTGQTPLGGTWSGTGIIDPISGIFDPAIAGIGTHVLTYTFGTGTCQKVSSRTVTVGAVPTVIAGADLTICEGDAAFVLGGQTPLGGVWSGIGITDSIAGIFNPNVSGIGTFTITYTFSNNVTGCDGIDTRIITVNPLPTVTTEDSTLYCLTSNNIQLTGYTPTTGGQWSGPGIVNPNTGAFNPQQAGGIGIYQLTLTFTDANGCTNSENLQVEVSFGDTVQAGPNISLCITDAPFNLTGQLPTTGGTWSGNGITDAIAGTFDPAQAGQGTHIITWTFGTGTCEKTSTRTIVVGSPPNVNAGADQFVCIDNGQILLSGYSPVGGVWSGVGIVDSIAGIFDPIVAGSGQFTVSYYVVNNTTGCEATDFKDITVGNLPPVSVTDSVIFCDNPNNIVLSNYTTASPLGGIWSGAGVVDPVNGIFSTTIAGGLGNYNLIYTYTAGNSCESSDTLNIEVIFGDTVVAGTPDTLCLGDNPITFTGFSPAGGTWSGPGIINANTGEFDPNFAGVGLHIVTYRFGNGTCEKVVTKTVLVDAPPTISIGQDQTVCLDNGAFLLNGYSPQGGTWSGVGIINATTGEFDPVAAGVGTHTLTYTFVNSASGCSNSATRDITVVPLPFVFAGDTVVFCDNPNNILLSDYVNFNPPGGTWSGTGIVDPTAGIFSTTIAGGLGNYNVTYELTDGNGCTNKDTLNIDVIFGDTVVAGPNVALCIDDGLYQLTGFSPFGGQWTGNGIIDPINGIFDPQVAGAGPVTLTYTFGNGTCEKVVTRVVFVGTPPLVNPGADQAICIDVPAFALGGYSPAGGIWTGVGIVDSVAGIFSPAAAGVGVHNLFYTVTNPVTGCETVENKVITINALPNVFAGDTVIYCNNPNDITLSGYSPAGGVWSGSGIVDQTGGVFNTGAAGGIGTYTLNYQFVDNNNCANDDDLIVEVIFGDTVLAGPNDSVCIDDLPFTLGGSPLGGTWTGTGVNTASGTFNPAISGAGTFVVTYTYGTGTCEKTDQKIVFVGSPIVIDAGPVQNVCEDATSLFLTGTSIADGYWSGAGIVDSLNGEFNPQLVGVGLHTVIYTYIDPVTGCVSTDTKQIDVKPLPVVNAGGTVTYCDFPDDIQLTNYSPTGFGGTWLGTGIVDPTLGLFNTGQAGGIGNYTVTYTFTDAFGCVNSDDLLINVIYGDTVKAGPDRTVCIDGGTIQLVGNSPLGGYFTGLGVDSFGVFDPTITGGGTHQIIYTQGVESCVKSDSLMITVVDLTTTTAGPDENTCLESGPINLSGNSPLGGIWSGSGIIDGTTGLFEPLAANNDTVFISYTYTDMASGCSFTDTKMVTINPLPNIDFIMSVDTACVGDTINFVNTSDVNVVSYQWFFGDGTTSVFFEPNKIYNTAGTYQVMLVGVSPEGCPDTTIQTIEIYELPTPSFTMNVDNGCAPLPVTFTNTSVGLEMEYLWDFGNGQTSTLANPGTVTYQQGINDTLYIVNLTVTNRCGSLTFTDTVFVLPQPVVNISSDISNGCTPLPVNFSNTSTGNPTSFLWDFGNGNFSTDSIPPTQFFTTVDTNTVYTITLTATNSCGSDVSTIQVTAEPGSIDAFFNADTTIGCQPLLVNFTSSATPNSTVTWDFGDGNTLAGPPAGAGVISHQFDSAGTFIVYQYVSNICGFDTASTTITVYPQPEVSFSHDAFACQDAPFTFTNTSPQPLAGVLWDFGDGNTSTANNPTHSYATPGTYTVTMTGYSVGFSCATDTVSTVQVFGIPTADFTPDNLSGCFPLEVNFTNTSSNGALFYSWDFGDGNVSNLQNPTHTFNATGNYIVNLIATDGNGCFDDTTVVNFVVFPSPTSSFTPDAISQCGLNDYVELTNTSQGATQYYWDFGNGQFSTLTSPTISYNQLGDYTITLATQNQFNCTDTTDIVYSVLPGPVADYEIETQNGCEPLTVQFTQTSTNSTNFYWYFGDGDSATVANPIHTYNDGGTYDVLMVASLDDVCFDTMYIPSAVFVDQAPTAAFTIEEVNSGSPTGTYNFINSSIGATSYIWDFGDGGSSTDENPQHRYDYNGMRQVQLTAISATGCEDTTIVSIAPTFFKGLFVPNAFSPRVGIGQVREFKPIGVGIEEYRVEVFSQWGELLWSSDVLDDNGVPMEGWDGMYNGEMMPQGAYVWKVHAVFKDGSNWEGMEDSNGTVRKIGSVTLLD